MRSLTHTGLRWGLAAVLAAALALPAVAQRGGRAATPIRPAHAGVSRAPVVPGLGFDYPHLAATGRPVVSTGNGKGTFVVPVFGGVPVYEAMPAQPVVVVVQQPPQTVVVQPPAPTPAPPAVPEHTAPPLEEDEFAARDLGEFTLVRQDGQVIQAIAFALAEGRLTYITREGLHRSVALEDLDLDATREINSSRGVRIILPG